MNNIILLAKEIHKVYKNGLKEVRAVNGITLEIKRKTRTAIVGPSGAGKSTLLHILGGLDSPTSGSVTLDGQDIYRLLDKERARVRNQKASFVFQFYHLLPEFTALENVMLPALMRVKGLGSMVKEIKEKAENILESVGLRDRVHHKPNELSGGESQRVAIARALINDPEVLLCDEPTGNLDSKTSEAIYELLLGLESKKDMTLVVATHDDKMCLRFTMRVYIKDGKIV